MRVRLFLTVALAAILLLPLFLIRVDSTYVRVGRIVDSNYARLVMITNAPKHKDDQQFIDTSGVKWYASATPIVDLSMIDPDRCYVTEIVSGDWNVVLTIDEEFFDTVAQRTRGIVGESVAWIIDAKIFRVTTLNIELNTRVAIFDLANSEEATRILEDILQNGFGYQED